MKILLASLVIGTLASGLQADEGGVRISDRQLNHEIHSAIVEDKTLPYCAHVVRVESDKGKVMLKGHVHSEEQKEKVGEKAATFAGDDNVVNEVKVVASGSTNVK